MVESPCTRNCELEEDICLSCERTVEEIVNWQNMSNAEKQDVIDRVKNNLE